MVLGMMTRIFVRWRSGSHTPLGNFTSKRGNKNFYKGRGGKKYGVAGPKGGFVLRSRPNFYMPDLTDFQLKPYVWPGEGLARTNQLESPEPGSESSS